MSNLLKELLCRYHLEKCSFEKFEKKIEAMRQLGLSYDDIQASFEVLVAKMMGLLPSLEINNRITIISSYRKGKVIHDATNADVLHSKIEVGAGTDPFSAYLEVLIRTLMPKFKEIEMLSIKYFQVYRKENETAIFIRMSDGEIMWGTVSISGDYFKALHEAIMDGIAFKILLCRNMIPLGNLEGYSFWGDQRIFSEDPEAKFEGLLRLISSNPAEKFKVVGFEGVEEVAAY